MIFFKNVSKSFHFFLEVPTLAEGRPRAEWQPDGQNDKFENPETKIYPTKNQSVFSNGEEVAQ